MKEREEEREDFKFRFLELKRPFWDYVSQKNVTPSKAIRHFIKQGLSETGGFSLEEQKALKHEIIELKRLHGSIGTNLNQIARYFNQHHHLIESDLHRNHQLLINNQKEITRLLNIIMAKL